MPRGRGGKREGVVGKAYANRTDLGGANVVSAQPVNKAQVANQTIPGQQYGAAAAQQQSISAVPMANTQTPPMQQGPAGAPAPFNIQGKVTPLDAPTDHGLPITHGLPIGDGAGPEVLKPVLTFNPASQALSLLNSLGDDVSPQVAYVRDFLAAQSQNQIS